MTDSEQPVDDVDSEFGFTTDGQEPTTDDRPPISPSQLGQFVSLEGCPQFFAYEFEDAGETERARDWKEAFEPLSPLFAADGEAFERRCVAALREHANSYHDHAGIEEWQESAETLRAVLEEVCSTSPDRGAPIVTAQTRLGTEIEAWPIAGDADFLLFWPTSEGFHVRVLDAKAAQEEKPYQQLQVAAYTLLLRDFLAGLGLDCEWTVSGGVLTREHLSEGAIGSATPERLPSFDLGPRETDVRRLLATGGAFDRLHANEEYDYQLAPKCGGCAYKEACYTNAIERRSTAMLGLTRGEQATLAAEGVATIDDLAALCHPPNDPRPYQYERPEPVPARKETYEALTNSSGLGERLPQYVQRAQAALGAFDPDAIYARAEREVPWLLGAGASTLPDDDPHPSFPDPEIERGSLVRVYCNVQHDSRRDRITMASAYVTSSKLTDAGYDPVTLSSFVPAVPEATERAAAVEREVVGDFLEALFGAIGTVADRTGLGDRAPLHLYFYTRQERDILVEALKRHRSLDRAAAMRDLLGLNGAITAVGTDRADAAGPDREGITALGTETHDTGGKIGDDSVPIREQPMVSIVGEEFRRRKASRTPNDGLIAVIEELTPTEDAVRFSDWTHHRDGAEIDLREAFRHRLFDCWVPYEETDDGIELLADDDDPAGYYPSRVRRGAQIPLEYVWAVAGKLTNEWVSEFDTNSSAVDGPDADGDANERTGNGNAAVDTDTGTAGPTRGYEQASLFDRVGGRTGETDGDRVESTDSEDDVDGRVAPFRWVDGSRRERRITSADLEALGRTLAACVAHVERGLTYRNPRIEKRPIDLSGLGNFSLGATGLRRAATEFLDLEYDTAREEAYRHYAMPIEGRLRTGRSVVVVAREVEETDAGVRVTGELCYDRWFDDPDRIVRSCRVSGADGATGGSWLVANALSKYGEPEYSAPYAVERGVPVTVEHIDPEAREIVFSGLDMYWREDDYRVRHRRFTTDSDEADDWTTLFAEGSAFVLDPQTDDVTGQHVLDALAADRENETGYVGSVLDSMTADGREAPTTDAFDADSVATFCEWAGEALDGPPNERQAAFIGETSAQFSLLQGPPGTGKTSGALALAILARVQAFEADGKNLSGAVVGESHKAVDEVVEDVAETYRAYREDPSSPAAIDDLRIVRLAAEPQNPDPAVTYLDYHDPTDAERLREITSRLLDGQRERAGGSQRTLADVGVSEESAVRTHTHIHTDTDTTGTPNEGGTETGSERSGDSDDGSSHTLVFATPGRLYGFLRRLGGMDGPTPEDWLSMGRSFFDLLAVDEASMMRLPTLLFAGAFVHDHAQVLIAGDHRQMPPVTVHDWEREDRRTIEEYAPHCSVLDFFRLLRYDGRNGIAASDGEGDAVASGLETDGSGTSATGSLDSTDPERSTASEQPDVPAVDFDEVLVTAGASIDLLGLEKTYRCHSAVASFLERYVYRRDAIPYESAIEHDPLAIEGRSAGLDRVLDGAPVTLVLHDEAESQQSNPTEAAITTAIAAALEDEDVGTGVVTPHNAQKGLLKSSLDDADVDTVERFQGGERDAIVVSATVSDPDFLESEREFILNPNRLTVAMSRMKRKLVVVASRSVFDLVPPDVEGYERARLWKGLYEDVGVLDRDPEWDGTVEEFVGDTRSPSGSVADGTEVSTGTDGGTDTGVVADTAVEVYSLERPPEDRE